MGYDDKLIYCYNCQSHTIYSYRDTHGNTGVESHCNKCGWYEWMNHAVELERRKWTEQLKPILVEGEYAR